jgi:hypothetical protein
MDTQHDSVVPTILRERVCLSVGDMCERKLVLFNVQGGLSLSVPFEECLVLGVVATELPTLVGLVDV